MRLPLLIAATCLAVASAAYAQAPSQEDEIRSARAAFNDAIARHDVPAIVTFLEEGYRISTSGGAFLDGRAAMGRAFAARFEEFEDALYVRSPTSIELSSVGPVAWEVGEWVGSWTTADGPFRTGGSYAAYWRKSSGKWLLHSELYVPLFCEGVGCG